MAIKIGSVKAFYRKNEENMLLKSPSSIYEMECEIPGTYIEDIENIKCELQKYDALRYRGARVRSRSRRALHSEQPTRQALLDERRHGISKVISEIYSKGSLVTNTNDIISQFESYYNALFSAPPEDHDAKESFVSLVKPLQNEECAFISDTVTIQEIELTIDQLPLSKTPSPDGLSSEFYKVFKGIISSILLDIFITSLELDALPQSFCKNHTVLIPKSSDKDKLRYVESYRPITLSNVDYKIFAIALSNRLQFAM